MTNRLSPIRNLLPKDNQCDYKARRSTTDVISFTKRQFIENEITGRIFFDLAEAFGRINGKQVAPDTIWKGLPIKLIKNILKGHWAT